MRSKSDDEPLRRGVTLADLPIWPGNPPFELERVNKIEDGASSNVSKLSIGAHTGTHVDAPVHFIPGAPGVDTLPLEVLTGQAKVVALDLPTGNITAAVLDAANIPADTDRVLLKTRNSDLWKLGPHEFRADFAGIAADGAEWIVARKIKLIGVITFPSDPKARQPTHEILLKAEWSSSKG